MHREELIALLDDDDLTDLVYSAKIYEGELICNQGIDEQLEYLLNSFGMSTDEIYLRVRGNTQD